MLNNTTNVNFFWTGGWDSTFRLLQLLLIEKKIVQPNYLKFPTRNSNNNNIPIRKTTDKEIETMGEIRQYLSKEYPHTDDLLLPTIFIDAQKIKPNDRITDSYHKIVKSTYIGNQYEVLARFAEQYSIDNIELCIESTSNPHTVIEDFVRIDNKSGLFRIDNVSAPEHIQTFFQNFSFPILKMSKLDMENYAQKSDWLEILNMTWFCHKPIFGRFPCGSCNPCIYVYEDGMGWRIPLFFRIFGRVFKKAYNSKIILKIRSLT